MGWRGRDCYNCGLPAKADLYFCSGRFRVTSSLFTDKGIAYYEPGHYREVLNVNNAQNSHQPSTMAACTLPDSQQPLLVNLPPVDNDGQLTHNSLN